VARLLTDLAWPVTTQRLRIRPAEQRDATATFVFRALPEVAEWTTSQTTDFAAWEAGFGVGLADTLVIELDGEVLGDLMLRVQDGWAQSEVKEQAVRALLAQAKYATSWAWTSLVAAIDPQRCGMAQSLGVVVSHGLRQGTPRGSKCFVFRVAMVISADSATAAMRASSKGACSGTR
jgi:hypothetical protein